jgi:hypothetical protein
LKQIFFFSLIKPDYIYFKKAIAFLHSNIN